MFDDSVVMPVNDHGSGVKVVDEGLVIVEVQLSIVTGVVANVVLSVSVNSLLEKGTSLA